MTRQCVNLLISQFVYASHVPFVCMIVCVFALCVYVCVYVLALCVCVCVTRSVCVYDYVYVLAVCGTGVTLELLQFVLHLHQR